MTSIFIDGLSNVRLIDNVIRADLVQLVPSSNNNEKFQTETTGSISMSIAGLVRTHEQLGQVLSKLAEQGVLKKNEASPLAKP
jgi:hypothetical protein